MELFDYIILAATTLFVIIDPIAVAPAFLAMTPNNSTEDRVKMAWLAALVSAGVLIAFVLLGQQLFRFLGITISAFKIAGSIVLLLIALDMLRARRSAVQETTEETFAGAEKEDVAITPLAIPMLAGPGAISTVVLLHTQARGMAQVLALIAVIIVVCFATYLILRFAASHGARWISPIGMKIATRIMGLVLAALAIQFALDGIAEQKEKLFFRDVPAAEDGAPPPAPE